MKFNPEEFEQTLNLETIFSDSEGLINLQMGYLKSGDFVLFEHFSNLELRNEEPEKYTHYYDWGALITVKKNSITSYNKKCDDERYNESEYFQQTFDEVIQDFKEKSKDIYSRMDEKELLNFMTSQLEKQNDKKFMSRLFEELMQSREISYIKEYFGI